MLNLFNCSCCLYPVFSPLLIPYSSSVCPVCYWHQDAWLGEHPTERAPGSRYSLNEARRCWPELVRKWRKEDKDLDKIEGKEPSDFLGRLASDEDLIAGDLEECIADKKEIKESCDRLRPVVQAIREKIPPRRLSRMERALDDLDPLAVVYDAWWSLIQYELTLPEPLHATLVEEDAEGRWVATLFDWHRERMHTGLRRIAEDVKEALSTEEAAAFDALLERKHYSSAAEILLPHVREESANFPVMDEITMRLELRGTHWEGLEDRLYQLLEDMRGLVPDSELWIYANFLQHKEYSEGVEFWLWRMYELDVILPRKIYDAFSRLVKEMRLEEAVMEGVRQAEEK